MANHKQIKVYNPIDDCITEIDEGIVELVQLLWDLSFETDNSCQELEPGIMWISLLNYDAEEFLTVIASRREEDLETEDLSSSMYWRMRDPALEGSWDYRVSLHDSAEVWDDESDAHIFDGDSEITLFVSIKFPVSDYDEILERLKQYAASVSEGPGVPVVNKEPKLGRNDPCWCGSGKKYKKCHLELDRAEGSRR